MQSTTPQLTAVQAAARLGIQRASLYAYVSRGVLRREVAADGKTSLFDAKEVEALSRRRRRRPAGGTVDVVLSTALTRIADEGVWYRGTPLQSIAGHWSFERTAEWLWSGEADSVSTPWPRPSPDRDRRGFATLTPTMTLLRTLGASLRPRVDVNDPSAVARQLIVDFADCAALTRSAARRRVPMSASIAERVAIRFGRPDLAATIDFILVLMADHEIASSTLAARVAASTQADAYAVVAAGLAVLSGRLHGGVTPLSVELIEEAARSGAAVAVERRRDAGELLPGFGHSVYRQIDPRARLLFDHLAASALPDDRLAVAHEVIDAARLHISAAPNTDLALAAFVYAAELPSRSAEWLFAIARTSGWIAHAIEEYAERPLRFRPRSVS